MIARANIKVPTTFVLPLAVADGVSVSKDTTAYVNALEDATFEVWCDNGDGSFTEVIPTSKSYNATSVNMTLTEAIDGKIRVSCKSARYIPSDESVLLESIYSGNGLMNENDGNLFTNQELKE